MNLWELFMGSILILGIAFVWLIIAVIAVSIADVIGRRKKIK